MEDQELNTDSDLFLLIADGDEQAFEVLYNRYLPQLYPVVLQIVKADLVVKDILQEVFLRLWINRARLSEILQPRNYIFRIAYNSSFTQLKKQFVANRAHAFLAEGANTADVADSLEDELNFAETRRLVEEAIIQLPDQSRKIYQMNRVAGYKPQQIAEELNISVQSVRNSLTRSGKLIRDHLKEHGIMIPLVIVLLQHS